MAEAKKTLVEEGTEFRGSLVSKCPVVVSGKIDGEVHAPSLTVSTTGGVYGKVRVGEILSEGEIAGEFDAETVKLSGRVNNNTVIRTKSLEVNLSSDKGKLQVSFGDCVLEVGDEPNKAMGGGAKPPEAPKPQPPKV
ncbi:MAG TPA: polymer-forming cytoskeletal protein [Blastocatellia bacterium]|nr:polymer-forming cytoskeletal protein [Blastocatellia bacterium]